MPDASKSFVTPQQAVVHALFVRHRSMSVVARQLGVSQIRVREALVQHERNRMRDAGLSPPSLREMLKGDVTTRFGVPRDEFGGRPAKHEAVRVPEGRSSGGGQEMGSAVRRFPLPVAGVRRLVVTSVESGADLHVGFWRNLKAYASALGAELVVLALGGNLPRDQDLADCREFLSRGPVDVAGLVDIASDEAVPARFARPLEAVRHRADSRWTLLPHAAIALETLPRMRSAGLKVQMTTGAATVPLGKAARRRSEVGAVVVEVTAAGFAHCRHLLAAADGEGAFHDLDLVVARGVVRRGCRVEAITFGDVHHAHLDPTVSTATWGLGEGLEPSLVDRLRPRFMVFHDVVDFDARNHHDARDHHKRFAQFASGGGDVRAELVAAARFLEVTRRAWSRSLIVGSNHDAALVRWLREADFRDDPLNALFFLESSLALHRRLAAGASPDGFFEQTLRHLSSDELHGVRFLGTDESLEIAGVEAAIHGHIGADGRPGDVRSFERLGIRATLGHTHRPTTREGILCAGVCATDLVYARGPVTAWAVGHVVTYATGARQHLILDGGRFHA